MIALPLMNPLFPEHEIESCTMNDGPLKTRRALPSVSGDCGRFTSASNEVTCSADPSRTIALVPGYTFDLVVRGPRIPLLSRPVVASASVSAEQKRPAIELFDSDAEQDIDLPGSEDLEKWSAAREEYEREFSVEALRAFDFEQPTFDSLCDIGRTVMTTKGLLLVSPEHANDLLAPPEGVKPASPLRPCEGFQCGHHLS